MLGGSVSDGPFSFKSGFKIGRTNLEGGSTTLEFLAGAPVPLVPVAGWEVSQKFTIKDKDLGRAVEVGSLFSPALGLGSMILGKDKVTQLTQKGLEKSVEVVNDANQAVEVKKQQAKRKFKERVTPIITDTRREVRELRNDPVSYTKKKMKQHLP